MRVVLDTNVWLSGLFWEGEASKIIEGAEKRRFEIIVSKNILLEIIDVLNREAKFSEFLKQKGKLIEDLIRTILSIGNLVVIKTKLNIIKEDIRDNHILELALDGKADYIISYDNHLLKIGEFNKTKVIEPKEFIKLLR